MSYASLFLYNVQLFFNFTYIKLKFILKLNNWYIVNSLCNKNKMNFWIGCLKDVMKEVRGENDMWSFWQREHLHGGVSLSGQKDVEHH